jgi:BirA family biotin operon repressor/biotin-[acetyl-CoA-carboxylase] ligase
MATFIFPTSLRVADLSGYSLAVGVGVAEALRSAGGDIKLKWPNDLVVVRDGRLGKLGGILIEVEESEGESSVLVGLGLNIDRSPDEIADSTSFREAFDVSISIEETLNLIAGALLEGHRQFEEARGFSSFSERWLKLSCFTRGRSSLTVDLGSKVVSGSFEGVDDRGALRLRTGAQELVLYSGHVLEWRV